MNGIKHSVAQWWSGCLAAWDEFWFASTQPYTLALIRICCGAMLVYVHIIWAVLIGDFFGPTAWVQRSVVAQLHQSDWVWSWLFYTDSSLILWVHQIVAILASLAMMLGLFTRWTIPLAWWLTLMVCHRMTGALFGLDQIVVMLSMYLMFSHCGSVWSLDAWLAGQNDKKLAHVSNNVATRLIQLHLCVIYLFGGLSKMRGAQWFEGSALWWTAVNYEYQSLDITWLANFPWLIAALTAATIFWETFYVALVWPKQTRPIALGMAVMVHGGIAVALGMVTFGTIMIVANLAFVSPEIVRRAIKRRPEVD
ncbi:MAG: hypothetical protein Aurels2KO_16490 [Aureliella sp.]